MKKNEYREISFLMFTKFFKVLEVLNIAQSSERENKPWGEKGVYKNKDATKWGKNGKVKCWEKNLNAVHQVLNKRNNKASARRWDVYFYLQIYEVTLWLTKIFEKFLREGNILSFFLMTETTRTYLLSALWVWISVIGENLNSDAFLCISLFQDELLPLNVSDVLETDQEQNSLCGAMEDFYLVTSLLSDTSEGHCKPGIE